jgi:uncharacterized repeat protein (TIGR03843 family)
VKRFPDDSWDPERPDIGALLAESAVVGGGGIVSASNYVFLVQLRSEAAGMGYGIYKPLRGERPLWDFPPALYKREVASYLLSEALGWRLVPPTVERAEGLEHGVGSLQLYVPADRRCTYFDLRDEHADLMRRFAVFDWLANNADRKGGHVLLSARGHIWGIDHGLTFHEEEKLRTVIWDYAGERLDEAWLEDIARVREAWRSGPLRQELGRYLSAGELRALDARAQAILREPTLPQPPTWRRPYPWPVI